MRRILRILARITGSAVGLVIGGSAGLALGLLLDSLLVSDSLELPDGGWSAFVLLGGLGVMIGATIGAAVGATISQKVLGQRSSFWKALLGAVVGLVVGVSPTALCLWTLYVLGVWHDGWWPFFVAIAVVCAAVVAGAVIGSGWRAKRGDAASGMQGVVLPADTLKLQPRQAECPFCHSTTFRVEQEAGSRRCSECHSVLPSYIQGNR